MKKGLKSPIFTNLGQKIDYLILLAAIEAMQSLIA